MFLRNLDVKEKEAFLSLAKELIRADGRIASEEEIYLMQYKDEMRLDKVQNEYSYEKACEIIVESSPAVRKKLYMELYGLAKCDADFAAEEKKCLENFAQAWSISSSVCEKLEDNINALLDVYKKMEEILK